MDTESLRTRLADWNLRWKMSENGQVKIGREFFAKIKLDYANWKFALVREFLQNCFDAPGCNQVDIEVKREGAGTSLVVRNNGRPMDRDTLFGKLLTLGGSGKNFEGENTGGFGVAKSLLYYTHLSYAIKTGKLRVTGSGAQYQVIEEGFLDGTESQVLLEGDVAEDLLREVRMFACMAQWRGTLTLNGGTVATDLAKGARRKDLGWGVVYTNRSFLHLCIVRLNGQPMFTRYTRFKGCVLVELNGKAFDTLTSNRDALKHPYDSRLSDLLTALAVDKKSALREQKAEYKRYLGEKLKNERKQPKKAEEGLSGVIGEGALEKLEEALAGAGLLEKVGPTGPGVGAGIKVVVSSREDAPKTISLGHEFILKNTTGMKVPTYWTPGEKFSKVGKDLVAAWAGVLLKLHQLLNLDGNFSVGFCFDEESEAEHEVGAYGRVYYVNPIRVKTRENGGRVMEPRFKSVYGERFHLIASAAHEIVHGAYGLKEHDEDYAGRLTDVMETVMEHLDSLSKFCKPIKSASEPEGEGKEKPSTIFGHPVTAVIRWMGKRGWDFERAKEVLDSLKSCPADGTIKAQLYAGAKGLRGDPANLTPEQEVELENS